MGQWMRRQTPTHPPTAGWQMRLRRTQRRLAAVSLTRFVARVRFAMGEAVAELGPARPGVSRLAVPALPRKEAAPARPARAYQVEVLAAPWAVRVVEEQEQEQAPVRPEMWFAPPPMAGRAVSPVVVPASLAVAPTGAGPAQPPIRSAP